MGSNWVVITVMRSFISLAALLQKTWPILPFTLYQLPIPFNGASVYITIIAIAKEKKIINGMPITWLLRRGRRLPHPLQQPGYLGPDGTRLNKRKRETCNCRTKSYRPCAPAENRVCRLRSFSPCRKKYYNSEPVYYCAACPIILLTKPISRGFSMAAL